MSEARRRELAREMPATVLGVVLRWGSTSWFVARGASATTIDVDVWGDCQRLFRCPRLEAGTPVTVACVGRDGSLSPATSTLR